LWLMICENDLVLKEMCQFVCIYCRWFFFLSDISIASCSSALDTRRSEAIPGEHSLLLTASYEPSTDRRKRIMHTSTRLRIKEWSERIYCVRSNCAILNFEGKYDGNRRNKLIRESIFIRSTWNNIFFCKKYFVGPRWKALYSTFFLQFTCQNIIHLSMSSHRDNVITPTLNTPTVITPTLNTPTVITPTLNTN
jgi:hypothetical protein